MSTNADNAYGPVPATEPLALTLTEGLGGSGGAADELKAAVINAYGRGYYAGTRRKKQQIGSEAKQRQENAMWHRYMAAALTTCCDARGWTAGDKPINTVAERTKLAADFADEAVKLARQRCRL